MGSQQTNMMRRRKSHEPDKPSTCPSDHKSRKDYATQRIFIYAVLFLMGYRLVTFDNPMAVRGKYDAIVVGSGLAGLSTALSILDRGGRVVIVEKEAILGGNSNKASSGINACCLNATYTHDRLEHFWNDTAISSGLGPNILIDTLVDNSAESIDWLQNRVKVDLSQLAQLGGHSHPRTFRPNLGLVGAELMGCLQRELRPYIERGAAVIHKRTRVTKLMTKNDGEVVGVECTKDERQSLHIRGHSVVLATGGFASDRSRGSILAHYRPDLLTFATTGGRYSTGDGIALGTSIGATAIDMEKVQMHPTGFVDPIDPNKGTKVLAAELLRGVGGILLHGGKRFCNELGRRDYITERMMSQNPIYVKKQEWGPLLGMPVFYLVLSEEAAREASRHVNMYISMGQMTDLGSVKELAEHMEVDEEIVHQTLRDYQEAATRGVDEYGKVTFNNVPHPDDGSKWYVGRVTPVLHYCMGGLSIDPQGRVIGQEGEPIPNLYAAGEVTGGIHGNNRLGGNSLLDCVVFGRKIGETVTIHQDTLGSSLRNRQKRMRTTSRKISMEQLKRHTKDKWVAIHGTVYDLHDFPHPGGLDRIDSLAGSDASAIFDSIHSAGLLEGLSEYIVGTLEEHEQVKHELGYKKHSGKDDCWVSVDGSVYDLTKFAHIHPGGEDMIYRFCGKELALKSLAFHRSDVRARLTPYLT